MSATKFHIHTKQQAELYFYISWSLNFWIAKWRTKGSAPSGVNSNHYNYDDAECRIQNKWKTTAYWTTSWEQRPSCEANSSSTKNYYVHRSPPGVSVHSHMNPVHALLSCSLRFTLILSAIYIKSPKRSLSLSFPEQNRVCITYKYKMGWTSVSHLWSKVKKRKHLYRNKSADDLYVFRNVYTSHASGCYDGTLFCGCGSP